MKLDAEIEMPSKGHWICSGSDMFSEWKIILSVSRIEPEQHRANSLAE